MISRRPWMTRLLITTPLALAAALPALPTLGQIEALRKSDDQFIQGLREQGMSDLLERFVETDPPEDPIAQAALEVALKEFIADDLLVRASEANGQGNAAEAVRLFNESRAAYEDVLAAQRKLVAEHQDDERLPLWQTDFAEMLLFRYLPRYYQQIDWVYEYGQPSAEQRKAYEDSVVEAYANAAAAFEKLSTLDRRAASEDQLRPTLESLGIWYKLKDYQSINTPYWVGISAHGVSLLPDKHPYFASQTVQGQKVGDVKAEKSRLRYLVVDAFDGALSSDERTSTTAKLTSGRALVWSDKIEDIDDGVEVYLEPVMAEAADSAQGFLATLGKAVGRWQGDEGETALEILGGMDRNAFVRTQTAQGNILPRLLAADLLFKIMMDSAAKAPTAERTALVAQAYDKAYAELIGGGQEAQVFRDVLFERWAASAGDVDDPASLPPAVRMGIGERLTLEGGTKFQQTIAAAMQPEPAVPGDAERFREQIQAMHADAVATLDRAEMFNVTLVGEDMEPGPILARGLFNLGMNKFGKARMDEVIVRKGNGDPEKFLEVAELWLDVGKRVPDAAQARDALIYSTSLTVAQDQFFNKDAVNRPRVRQAYKEAFELLDGRWPDAVHDQRVYAAFHLYEKPGLFDEAVAVYRKLPPEHNDFFQARRQLVLLLQRQYRRVADELRLIDASKPAAVPPAGVDPAAHAQEKQAWESKHAQVLEDRDRKRDDIIEEAELIILDAEDAAQNDASVTRRFTAWTALGACKVVLAGMEADRAQAQRGLDMLEGFEEQYAPSGPLSQLADLQPQPDAAKANLQGIVQSAQQQRILILLDAGQIDKLVVQARKMMEEVPDVAAAVVNGVLRRIDANIERERRAEANAPFEVIAEEARANIRFQASAAVQLGTLLEQWARGQGFDSKKMVPYKLALVEALMLADQQSKALQIMEPLVEEFPNSINIRLKTGKAYLSVFRSNDTNENFNGAMKNLSKVVEFYNTRPEKPAEFWDAWLHICYLLEAKGGKQAASIPKQARILIRVDENLGGPAFKDKFLEVFERNGGIQQLQVQPSANTPATNPPVESVPSDSAPQAATEPAVTPVAAQTPTRIVPLMVIGVTGVVLLLVVAIKPLRRRLSS